MASASLPRRTRLSFWRLEVARPESSKGVLRARLFLEPLEGRTVPSVLFINDQTNSNPATWLITANSVTETVGTQPPDHAAIR